MTQPTNPSNPVYPVHDDTYSYAAQEMSIHSETEDENEFINPTTVSASATIDYLNGSVQQLTLGASGVTLTVKNMPKGFARLLLRIKQDATGSRTLPTFSPAADWGTAGAPTLTITAAKVDELELWSVDAGVHIIAKSKGLGFSN